MEEKNCSVNYEAYDFAVKNLLDQAAVVNGLYEELCISKGTANIVGTDMLSDVGSAKDTIFSLNNIVHGFITMFVHSINNGINDKIALLLSSYHKICEYVPEALEAEVTKVLSTKTKVLTVSVYRTLSQNHELLSNVDDFHLNDNDIDLFRINSNDKTANRITIYLNVIDGRTNISKSIKLVLPTEFLVSDVDTAQKMLDEDMVKVTKTIEENITDYEKEENKIKKNMEDTFSKAEYELYLSLKNRYDKV